mmetsp:Transcript_39671/g.119179  ORF Transcript_39671/g.119179 Transcript_39671/m.119179 type:complete len:257 (-) Transcript_39671:238-1008(-)
MRGRVVPHRTVVHGPGGGDTSDSVRGAGRVGGRGGGRPESALGSGAHARDLGSGGMVLVGSGHGGVSPPDPPPGHLRHGLSGPARNPPPVPKKVEGHHPIPQSRLLVDRNRGRSGLLRLVRRGERGSIGTILRAGEPSRRDGRRVRRRWQRRRGRGKVHARERRGRRAGRQRRRGGRGGRGRYDPKARGGRGGGVQGRGRPVRTSSGREGIGTHQEEGRSDHVRVEESGKEDESEGDHGDGREGQGGERSWNFSGG